MELYILVIRHCKLESCQKEFRVPKGSKRIYCTDAHRKYAWKKAHWETYLLSQRKYKKNK